MEVSSRIILLLSDTRLTVAVVVEALLHQSATSLCVWFFRSNFVSGWDSTTSIPLHYNNTVRIKLKVLLYCENLCYFEGFA